MILHINQCLVLIIITQSMCAENENSSLSVTQVPNDDFLINIGENQFPNPCKYTKCPGGRVCSIQYTPRLLKIPIAHCVKSTTIHHPNEGSLCVEFTVGTNILHCKSEAEWQTVGSRQCYLRRLEAAKLTGTKVKHPCPNSRGDGEVQFLTASYNCCAEDIHATQNTPSATKVYFISETEEVLEKSAKSTYAVLLFCFGVVTLLALLLLMAIRMRNQHKSIKRPSTTPAKSVENYMDDSFGYTDKSLLIDLK